VDTATRAKLALIVMAAILFAGSLQLANADWLRWVAIGMLVLALLLRFVGPRRGPRPTED
jgi:protein-S-isoprenylcysteine O-methyltransferase Ste14